MGAPARTFLPQDLGEEVVHLNLSIEGRKRAAIVAEHIANALSLPVAASMAGVPYATVSIWRQRAPEFQAMLAAAEERRTQLLEAEAWRRALAGSDTMLIFMLKAARPAQYRENHTIELTGPNGAALELSDPQRAARIAALLVAMRDKQDRAKEKGITVDAEYRELKPMVDDASDLFD